MTDINRKSKASPISTPNAWPLIYQVEARTRLEHAPRVRRRGISEHKTATEEGKTHAYDPERPWDWVFGQLTHKDEKDWWWDELDSHLFENTMGGRACRPVRRRRSSSSRCFIYYHDSAERPAETKPTQEDSTRQAATV